MVKEDSPWLFTGTGTGKIPPRGDGDGGLSSDGEFPVAIFTREVSASRYGRPARIRPDGARMKGDTSLTSWSNFPSLTSSNGLLRTPYTVIRSILHRS
jgi:hypothetical protein